ncbi:MAG: (Fe-S)-binding protein [Candidatus Helarchaeota archaeon]|nr:(Fe-S)-binding protein [Candidatus Helarchaeota archaeon]
MSDPLIIDMLKCARCGKCRSLCPSFKTGESKWETTSARGRVLLSLGLAQNKIPATKQLISDIYGCFFCKYCSELCPSEVDVSKIIEVTRATISERGLTPNPVQFLLTNLDESHNIFNLDQEDRLLWAINVEEILEDRVCKKADVGFFVGCLAAFKGTLSIIPEALTLIMDKLNINFTVLGEEEWCCGNPYIIAGASESKIKEIATHNVEKMTELGIKNLITSCPGCYRVWSFMYPRVYGKLPFKVQHSSQFLAQLIKEKKLKITNSQNLKVGYQDPCELGRHCGEYNSPRTVLEAIPNINLIELENNRENSECCGGGGLVKALHPSLALNQGKNKIKQYHSYKVDLLITACPSCFENYFTSLESCDTKLDVKDLNELIAEQLDLL